jgi:hypothetical protein
MHKSLILGANKELIDTLCECILNCLNGNVQLSDDDKNKLYKYRNYLRQLLRKRDLSLKKKKGILVQKGSGFLPIILSAVLSLLQ